MKRRIFVSVNSDRSLDARRILLKKTFLERLDALGFEPQIFFESGLPRSDSWSFDQVIDVMRRCHGAAILGFPRWRVTLQDGQTIKQVGEYSHVEGAVALALQLPTLISAEVGVLDRGIVYQGGGRVIAPIPEHETSDNLFRGEFVRAFDNWIAEVEGRPDIFLGYCSRASGIAAQVQLLIERAGGRVHNWAMDFRAGASILEEIDNAKNICRRGVFIFSEDDPLEAPAGTAAPRDNVVFEAGAFVGTKGHRNCLIIRVGAAKMPADLGGAIYAKLDANENVANLDARLRDFVERSIL